MFVRKQTASRTSAMNRQQGWLLLVVVIIVLLIALGVVMLMSQGQLSLRSVRQAHHAIQGKINQWPPMLYSREYVDDK
tara:strand:+ start:12254 stop:12487 length:234 start_codon:yes stop_codon:yes gene_type:complete